MSHGNVNEMCTRDCHYDTLNKRESERKRERERNIGSAI